MNHIVSKRIQAVRRGKTDILSLGNLGLTELPPEVYELTHLRELSVVNFYLVSHQSTINLFRNLARKEGDEAFINKLEESEAELREDLLVPKQLQFIHPEISRLTALEILDLRCNELAELPDTIGNLPRLRRLDLWQKQIQTLPDSLVGLPCLEYVNVEENPIGDTPHFPQFAQYEPLRAHYESQIRQAIQHKDFKLAAWLHSKQNQYGLIR